MKYEILGSDLTIAQFQPRPCFAPLDSSNHSFIFPFDHHALGHRIVFPLFTIDNQQTYSK